ncbi:MAG: hypothetical protein M3P93_12075 [Actinomycetota bacterium]|nr:hypothetical protein [Actinomycetota bacterium]
MAALPAEQAVADFDSASAMLRATAAALQGRTFRAGGRAGSPQRRCAPPRRCRCRCAAYARVSGAEAVRGDRHGDLDAEAVAR